MTRHFVAAVLIAMFVAPAGAATPATPVADAMKSLSKMKRATGGTDTLILKIQIETADKAAVDRCSEILSENGMAPKYTFSGSSSAPKATYKLEGSKEYGAPSDAADDLVAKVSAIAKPGKTTGSISRTFLSWSSNDKQPKRTQ